MGVVRCALLHKERNPTGKIRMEKEWSLTKKRLEDKMKADMEKLKLGVFDAI